MGYAFLFLSIAVLANAVLRPIAAILISIINLVGRVLAALILLSTVVYAVGRFVG